MIEARIVAALVNATWQSVLVTAVAALALRLHGRTSARVRCAIWCAVLFIVAALPAIDFLQPRTVAVDVAPRPVVVRAIAPKAISAEPIRITTAVPAAPVRPHFDVEVAARRSGLALEQSGRPLVWLWLGVATLLALRLLLGLGSLSRMRRRFTTLRGDWLERSPRLPKLPVCASDGVGVPCLVGFVHPTIVLPRPLVDELAPDDLRRIVLHEAAHAQRLDHWLNLFVQCVRAALFFNPAVHFVAARIAVEREIACDDRVVELSGDRVVYAACLSALARTVSLSHAHAVPGFFNGRAQIVVRIEQLLDRAHDGTSRLGRRSAFALVTLAVLAAVLVQFGVPLVAVASRVPEVHRVAATIPRVAERFQPHMSEVWRPLKAVAPVVHPVVARVALTAKVKTLVAPAHAANVAAHVVPATLKHADPRVAVVALQTKDSPAVRTLSVNVATKTLAMAGTSASVRTGTPSATVVVGASGADQDGDASDGMTSEHDKPDFIDALAAAGYRGLSVDQLLALRDHGVSVSFLSGLKAAGYGGVSVDDLIRMRDHGVRPSDIPSLNGLAHQRLSVDQLITLRDHGVVSSYANELAAAGVAVSFDDLVKLRDHGVNPAFVTAMRSQGFAHLNADQLIELRDHGVSAPFVAELRGAGYTNVSIDDLVRLRDHGVNGAFLERAHHYFTGLPSIDDLIRLRDAGE